MNLNVSNGPANQAEAKKSRAVASCGLCVKMLTAVALVVLIAGCRRVASTTEPVVDTTSAGVETTPVKASQTTMVAVRFLEDRVKGDADDLVALNKLSAYYLQLHRETANIKYLELALHSARSSLGVLPADQNVEGLVALAQAEYQTHDFTSARNHARELIAYRPQKSYGYQIYGDALLELGDYDEAAEAYARMEELDRGSMATESRLARLSLLRGDPAGARRHYSNALTQAKAALVPSSESIAWCQWQLGELAFSSGDYSLAENFHQAALITLPGYYRALASLGRVKAALGDLQGAIEKYEHAIRIIPDPQFVASLGDLYKVTGRAQEANAQYRLVEKIGKLSDLNGSLYGRQIAVFEADHDVEPEEAYARAVKEHAVRKDIFGADAVAWTALKAGRIEEARAAIREALRLGTREARLFYHAGMIARAAGDRSSAIEYLEKALALNPQFDPLQVPLARKALEQ
jgi:tetratricopeptide (TPR) repeat protein